MTIQTSIQTTTKTQPYTKSLEDELDWKLLDQLYGVTSQISNFCFEIKKFCITTEFVVLALMAKFTENKLDSSLFITGLAIPVCFWFLDSVAYYYQVSIRGTMDNIRVRIEKRNNGQLTSTSGVPIINPDRIEISKRKRIFNATINHSMWLYVLIISADIAAWALYIQGTIK